MHGLRGLRGLGVDAEFSVGWALGAREHAAIAAVPESVWSAAIDVDGYPRDPADSAAVVELTGMITSLSGAGALR